MWLITPYGFYSVVENTNDSQKQTVLVRSRNKEDLLNLSHFTKRPVCPFWMQDADYRYRIIMPKTEWAAIVAQMANEIDYPNFKNRAPKARKKIYTQVWWELSALEDLENK